MKYVINLFSDLLARSTKLTTSSKCTELNGLIYLLVGLLLVIWPRLVQTLFMERAFVADEQGPMRVIGLTVVVIGWLYLFGGRSGGEQVVTASVVDRLIFRAVGARASRDCRCLPSSAAGVRVSRRRPCHRCVGDCCSQHLFQDSSCVAHVAG
jgi:uncharacterized protein YjeT (DUF2065 family)